jgi:hypothetical protein
MVAGSLLRRFAVASTKTDESTKPEAKREWKPMTFTKVGTFGDVMLGAMTNGNDGANSRMN